MNRPLHLRRGPSNGGVNYEKNFSAEPSGSQAPPWLPRPHGDQEWTQGACPPTGEGAQAPVGVTDRARALQRLKKRRDFLAAAKGSKAVRGGLLLEARRRDDDGRPRVGFTVSKRTAVKAVERNRIRRRLRALALDMEQRFLPEHDYVLVARRRALTQDFQELRAALGSALAQLHGRKAGETERNATS